MKKVEARCPVCRDLWLAEPDLVGTECECGNCHQRVTMVPRSSASRQRRALAKALIILAGIALAVLLYNWRLAEMTHALGGTPIP